MTVHEGLVADDEDNRVRGSHHRAPGWDYAQMWACFCARMSNENMGYVGHMLEEKWNKVYWPSRKRTGDIQNSSEALPAPSVPRYSRWTRRLHSDTRSTLLVCLVRAVSRVLLCRFALVFGMLDFGT